MNVPLLDFGTESQVTQYFEESAQGDQRIIAELDCLGDGKELSKDEVRCTALRLVLEPITLENDLGIAKNPSGIEQHSEGVFFVRTHPADLGGEYIKWQVETGSVSFQPGGADHTTGKEVRVKGVGLGAFSLAVDLDRGADDPKINGQVLEKKRVKLSIWIVRDNFGGNAPFSESAIRSMIDEVNKIYKQAAIEFYIDSIGYINNSIWNVLASNNDYRALQSQAQGTGGMEVYFVKEIRYISASGISNSSNSPAAGLTVTQDGNYRTVAHELGHAFGLDDIYIEYEISKNNFLIYPSRIRTYEVFLRQDWSGGTGTGYYEEATKQVELLPRLLMYGERDDAKSDISFGQIHGVRGYVNPPVFDFLKTGLSNMNRNAIHY